MDDNRNPISISILIGCGVLLILLSVFFVVVRFGVRQQPFAESAEAFESLLFGAGYLLLGLSRKSVYELERQRLFTNLSTVALILGTVFLTYSTYIALK